jgi:hypothetical protein
VIGEMIWPWIALLSLGAVHGLNPGMGWLFAVALGLQQQERRAVWRALLPLAVGHALAIAVVVGLAAAIGLVLPVEVLKWVIGTSLVILGVSQLLRHRHLSWGGMRVTGRDLVIWSFLMATAHGAGLMALPFAIEAGAAVEPVVAHASHAAHAHHAAGPDASPWQLGAQWAALIATIVHAAGYLLVTAGVAALVYERLGVGILRRAWLNVDQLWAGALVLTGALTVAL